jgi:hypothetical protein
MAVLVRRSAGTFTSISSNALNITLDLRDATKSQIERAMQGHILASAELIVRCGAVATGQSDFD